MITVSNEDPTRKDTNMKLLYFFTALLALSLAEEEKQAVKEIENVDESAVEASNIELLKEVADLTPAASSHSSQGQRERRGWQSQSVNSWVQPAVQNDYYTSAPVPSTTTSVPVLKNEVYYGDNGAYKYEYKIADGTWVAEEGYYTDPKQTEESLVKKGWYSFLGADGVQYTVKYWADHTGYHAYGDHLPSAAQAPVSPSQQYTTQAAPTYKPPQQTYNDEQPQQTYYPSKQTYNPPQPTYKPPQQSYNPPQQTYNPPQQTYNPPQQTYNPPQQIYYPTQSTNQQNYNQNYNQQQQTYYPNYNV